MTMGFETLPHNDAAALMNHLATKGDYDDNDEDDDGGEDEVDWADPLSTSAASSDWNDYDDNDVMSMSLIRWG